MAEVRLGFSIVNTLPDAPYAPTHVYIVKSSEPGLMEVYTSNNDGSAVRHIINKTEIASMIATAMTGLAGLKVVADIAARDALLPLTTVTQVMVLDATADPSVESGTATYVYDPAGAGTWHKISEANQIDAVTNWANIVGKPTSSAAAIDQAVTDSHTHANKAVLDDLGVSVDGLLTYDGETVGAVASTVEW